MAAKEVLDRAILIKAIHEAHGKITLVARAMNVSCQTIRNYGRRYATVQQAIDEARQDYDDGLLDEAELALRASVRDKAAWAVKYVLDKKGKERGYLSSQEIDLTTGGESLDMAYAKMLKRVHEHYNSE